MASRPAVARAASFSEHLKQALESLEAPEWLGCHSPLAAPYFLGPALRGVEPSPRGRGQALCAEIEAAVQSLWGGPLPDDGHALLTAALAETGALAGTGAGGRYDCLILELNYLKQRYRPAPKNQAEIYHDILHISRPTHDRHLRAAVERLAALLLQRLRPAVRPEQPVTPPTLIGRERLLAHVLTDLAAGKTVSLTGPGGIGKTSAAAAVSEQWPSPAVFWYTFRPTLNDQLESLLFALGHFLHRQGASTLWHQLVADGGRIQDPGLALGLALAGLGSLAARPLLCFDELELLHPLRGEAPHTAGQRRHGQLLEFLDSLRGHAPMLLLGQRAFWPSDTLYTLEGWTPAQLGAWLASWGVAHRAQEAARLHAYTAGNPRLAELCVALYQAGAGETLADVLDQLPQLHALLPVWLRLERRLPPAERRLVHSLAVFRAPAPADVWLNGPPEQAEALTQLVARRLVQEDEQGGVALLPALREVVYAELPPETQAACHAQAAQVRAERGEYTAAAYHLAQAGDPEAAVTLWYPQRSHEIQRGQAGAALALFAQIEPQRLPPRTRQALLLLRSELYTLVGEPAQVIDDLAQAEWPAGDPATPEAKLRLGQAQEAQGRPAAALESYQAGLDAVTQLLRQGAQLHAQRSLTHLRQREMQQAQHEANLACFHAETMLGVVHDERGDYATAQAHYLRALALAEETGYLAGSAQTHHYLAMLAGRRQELDQARTHFDQALAFYEQVGDRVNREIVRSNLASAYIQARQFEAALAPAELALRFFAAMGNPFRTAQNASNLAETHAELGNLAQAQHYAELTLQQEEPHSHPYALYTLGTVYRARGDWAQAELHYGRSRQIAEQNDDAYLLAFAWRALGELYAAQQRAAEAQRAFGESLAGFRQLNLAEELRQTEALLARCDANHSQSDA